MHWSRDWPCTDHVTDHAVISWLSCTESLAVHTLITWLIMHWSSGYHALITWLSCTDHVVDQTLIMWQIMQLSRGYHALIKWLIILCSWNWSCNDHVATMYWSRDWSCTDHVNDHALFTWLIMNWSRGSNSLITWISCTDCVPDMHRSRD